MQHHIQHRGRLRKTLERQACPACGWFRHRVVMSREGTTGDAPLLCVCSWCGLERKIEQIPGEDWGARVPKDLGSDPISP